MDCGNRAEVLSGTFACDVTLLWALAGGGVGTESGGVGGAGIGIVGTTGDSLVKASEWPEESSC